MPGGSWPWLGSASQATVNRILVVVVGRPDVAVDSTLERIGRQRVSVDLVVLSPERRLLTSLAVSVGHLAADPEDAALREAEQEARSALRDLPPHLGLPLGSWTTKVTKPN